MILYHGSNMAIDGIDLNRCRPYKDFGRGFYLTDIREQAQRMAARTARMFSGNPTLTMFEFDLEEAQSRFSRSQTGNGHVLSCRTAI